MAIAAPSIGPTMQWWGFFGGLFFFLNELTFTSMHSEFWSST